jgi:hypothetical protein
MSARQGKIARLPEAVRAELNQRILDGQSGKTILCWLNELPDAGDDFNDTNLTNWRKGGYQDWLNRRDRIARTKEMAAYSVKLAASAGGNLSEGAAAILSGKVLELVEMLDGLVESAEAEEGAEAKTPEQIAATAAALKDLTESLATLRTGDQNNVRLQQNNAKLDLDKQKLAQAQESIDLAKKQFMRQYARDFGKWAEDQRVRGILAGADSTDAKTEKLGQIIFGEDWK